MGFFFCFQRGDMNNISNSNDSNFSIPEKLCYEMDSLLMETLRFEDTTSLEYFDINIRNIISSDYGFYTWPSARILAMYIWKERHQFKGVKILEIGSGTSLPGLIAAVCGAEVVLTDKEDAHEILENAKSNWLSNNPVYVYQQDGSFKPSFLKVSILGFTWGHFSPDILDLNPDFVLGADCFYDNSEVFEDAIASIHYFIEKNPHCRFLTTYQERSSQRSILYLLQKWNLQARSIDTSNLPLEELDLKNTIHLIEIYRK